MNFELDVVGGALLLDHLRVLIGTGAYLVLLAAVGRRLTQRWALKGVRAGERLGYQITLGAGAVALVVLALGLAQRLTPLAIAGALALLLVWSRREVLDAAHAFPRAARGVVSALPPGLPRAVGAVVAVAFTLTVTSRALMPPVDWATQTYHLPLPLHWIAAGGFAVPEGNTALSLAGLQHLLVVPLLVFVSPAAAQVLNVALLFVLVAFVGSVAWRFGRPPFAPREQGDQDRHGLGAAVAILAMVGTTMMVLVAETARVETTLALFLIAGHVALIRAAEAEWNPGWVLRAGLVLGGAAWLAPSAVVYGVGLVPVVLWAAFRDGRVGAAFNRILTLAMLAVAMAGPWWMLEWRVYGSPLYPRGASPRVPPWMADLFGTPMPPGLASDPTTSLAGPDLSLLAVLLRPGAVTPEAEAGLYVLSPLLLLAPAAFLGRKRRIALALAVPVALAVTLLVATGIPSPRSLIAVVPALALLAGLGAEALAGTLEGGRRMAFGVFLAAMAVAGVGPVAGSVFDVRDSLPYAAGRSSGRETLAARELEDVLALGERLDAEAPAAERILLLGESRELYLPPGVLADVGGRNWPLIERSGAAATCLAGSGVTHVVVHDTARDGLEAFLVRCGTRLEGAPRGYRLYRVGTS